MKYVNIASLILIIIGGINWGLVGLFDLNVISTIFGLDTILTNVIYVLVGLAAIWSFVLLKPLSDEGRYRASGRY